MARIHLCDARPPRLVNTRQGCARKPDGLWWSEGDTWRDHVSAGRAAGVRAPGRQAFEVTLRDGFRLLRIDSFAAVMELSRRFARPLPHAPQGFFWQKGDRFRYDPDQDEDLVRRGHARAFMVDWGALTHEWDGVEVGIPVGPARGDRPFVEWLDIDWDIPSGCAWRVDQVRLELVLEPDLSLEGQGF